MRAVAKKIAVLCVATSSALSMVACQTARQLTWTKPQTYTKRLQPGDVVVVSLADGRKVSDQFVRARPDALDFESSSYKLKDIRSISISYTEFDPVKTLLVGVAAGYIAVRVFIYGLTHSDSNGDDN